MKMKRVKRRQREENLLRKILDFKVGMIHPSYQLKRALKERIKGRN